MTNPTPAPSLYTEFVTLVHNMRHAQCEYFRCRDGRNLQRAKKLEKEVDAHIARYAIEKEKTPSLFDNAYPY